MGACKRLFLLKLCTDLGPQLSSDDEQPTSKRLTPYNERERFPMVRDGYFYGLGCVIAAGLIAWLAGWAYAIPVLLLASFFLWFFRDPSARFPRSLGRWFPPEMAR